MSDGYILVGRETLPAFTLQEVKNPMMSSTPQAGSWD